MISGIQCRMARAALDWTVRDLGRMAGINFNSVVRMEKGHDMKASINHKVERAFREAGVEFRPDTSVYYPHALLGLAEAEDRQAA